MVFHYTVTVYMCIMNGEVILCYEWLPIRLDFNKKLIKNQFKITFDLKSKLRYLIFYNNNNLRSYIKTFMKYFESNLWR